MRKLLLSLVAMMFTVIASAQVVFDIDNNYKTYFPGLGESSNDSHDGDITEATSFTVDGVTITVSPAAEGVSNANRIWSGSPRLRMYSGVLTIASAGHKITCVEFDAPKFDVAVSQGTLSGKQWTGSESEVAFTINKNTQMKKITVTLDAEVTPQPEEHIANTAETAYTVDKAIELIAAGKGLDDEVYVKGKICSIKEISVNYGNATYNISNDGQSGAAELTIFRGLGLNGEKFTAEDALKVGDEVIVVGKLVDYQGTPEMTSGNKIYSLNGQTGSTTGGGTDTPDTPTTPEVKGHLTIAEFLAKADTENAYEVCGTVTSIANTTYGNLYIEENGSELYIYGVLDEQGQAKNFQNLGVAVGDKLTVTGVYTTYNDAPQIKNAQFVKVEKALFEAEGDGSQANPYTANDVKHLVGVVDKAEKVWVSGTVLGFAKSGSSFVTEFDEKSNTNLALGTEDCWVPVALPVGDVRDALNLYDNPGLLGQEISVFGTLETYFSVPGVKNVSEYVAPTTGGEEVADATYLTGKYEVNYLKYDEANDVIDYKYEANMTVVGQQDGKVTITGLTAQALTGTLYHFSDETGEYDGIEFDNAFVYEYDEETGAVVDMYPSFAEIYDNAILFYYGLETEDESIWDAYAVTAGQPMTDTETYTISITYTDENGQLRKPVTSNCHVAVYDDYVVLFNLGGLSYATGYFDVNGDLVLDASMYWPYVLDFAAEAEMYNVRLTAKGDSYVYNALGEAQLGADLVANITLTKGRYNAIQSINSDESSNNVLFNLMGQRVNAVKKGIVIKNGKKMLVK